uniref:Uncharacterized protein n=1 Tax=Anguilla anguilla TaxID=7936 RepID=A0A0E9PPR8_ANGAN
MVQQRTSFSFAQQDTFCNLQKRMKLRIS